MQAFSALLVTIPAVLQAFLGHHGQALSHGVDHVNRACVMVNSGLARIAIPVLADPVHVQVERADW